MAETIRKSQIEVEKAKEAMIEAAKAEAQVQLKQARQQIEDEKQKAMAEIKDVAVTLALDVASKLLSQKLDDSAHRSLAEQYVKDVQQKAANA